MALTPSTMLPLGTKALHFELLDAVSNTKISLGKGHSTIGTVIMFICNHCPYVKHLKKELAEFAKEYQKKNIAFIAINSNDVENYPEDSPEKMREDAQQFGYIFPYLYDESQEIAKAYQAACTPDFYLFDKNLSCVYRGQFDDSRPGNHIPVTGKDLKAAIDNLLTNKPIDPNQKPSMGCNIKWKK